MVGDGCRGTVRGLDRLQPWGAKCEQMPVGSNCC